MSEKRKQFETTDEMLDYLSPNIINTKKLKDGDILGFSARRFEIYATPIKMLTRSPYNHVGGIITRERLEFEADARIKKVLDKHPDEEFFVAEARIIGFVLNPLSMFIKMVDKGRQYLTVKRLSPSKFPSKYSCEKRRRLATDKLIQFVLERRRYDFGAIVTLGVHGVVKSVFRRLGLRNNYTASKNRIFCSEAICRAYYIEGDDRTIFVGKNDKKATCATITPGDIMKTEKVFYVTGWKQGE